MKSERGAHLFPANRAFSFALNGVPVCLYLLCQLHVAQKYDITEPLQQEGLEAPSFSGKDLIQPVPKQRENKAPVIFFSV